MEQKRKCPECGNSNYLFRGRKKIPAENGQAEAMDTKFRCKDCEHVWTERMPVKSGLPEG